MLESLTLDSGVNHLLFSLSFAEKENIGDLTKFRSVVNELQFMPYLPLLASFPCD